MHTNMHDTTAGRKATPHLGRLSDLQAAQLWLQDVHGELFFTASAEKKTGEFFIYQTVPQPDGKKRACVRYLAEPQVESRVLSFLISLCDSGASLRITPGKIRSIKTLAGLLLLQQEGK